MAKTKDCSIIKKHYIWAFAISLTISIGLIVTSFFIPPMGEIAPSVLQAVGELFLWPSLAFAAKAVEEGRKAKIVHGKTTFVVGSDNNEEVVEEDGDNHS